MTNPEKWRNDRCRPGINIYNRNDMSPQGRAAFVKKDPPLTLNTQSYAHPGKYRVATISYLPAEWKVKYTIDICWRRWSISHFMPSLLKACRLIRWGFTLTLTPPGESEYRNLHFMLILIGGLNYLSGISIFSWGCSVMVPSVSLYVIDAPSLFFLTPLACRELNHWKKERGI